MWEDVEVVLRAVGSGRDGREDSSGQEVWRLMSTKTRCPIKVYDVGKRCWISLRGRRRRGIEGLCWLGMA